jgi:hypothetical protein
MDPESSLPLLSSDPSLPLLPPDPSLPSVDPSPFPDEHPDIPVIDAHTPNDTSFRRDIFSFMLHIFENTQSIYYFL